MEKRRKEKILNEIEREEQICQEIYQEILKNRMKYEEQIRKLNQAKISNVFEYTPGIKQKPRIMPKSPGLKNKFSDNKENVFPLKNLSLSPKSKVKGLNIQIPFNNHINEGLSSRKNPLDSLGNTTDREEIMLSIDSLRFSKDSRFL